MRHTLNASKSISLFSYITTISEFIMEAAAPIDWSRLVSDLRTYVQRTPTEHDRDYPNRRSQRSLGGKRLNRVQRQPHGPEPSSRRGSNDGTGSALIDRNDEPSQPSCDRNCLDGLPGMDGAPGLDGVPGTDGRDGRDGLNGKDGKDGKDGRPGEKGPMGPPGPVGETGRRGRLGPPGKMGPPGHHGVCVYQAKYDCSPLTSQQTGKNSTISSNAAQPQLLMAPTMVGGTSADHHQSRHPQQRLESQQASINERQVSVNEGDNIQLSCGAFGLPKPIYVWRRSDKRSTILLEAQTGLRVTSYSGSQLPLANVDRLQAGSYECLASNGVPPSASKHISLDINYKPTVRLTYPLASFDGTAQQQQHQPIDHRVRLPPTQAPPQLVTQLGASILIECLVEANPSAIAYWMFQDELIMAISVVQSSQAANTLQTKRMDASVTYGKRRTYSSSSPSSSSSSSSLIRMDSIEISSNSSDERARSGHKYVITESTGQLTSGASYTILTLNVTHVELSDIGRYKCVAKNLIDRTVGNIDLVLDIAQTGTGREGAKADFQLERLDIGAGWPIHLVERNGAPLYYATFGVQHKHGRSTPDPANGESSLVSMISSFKRISLAQEDGGTVDDEDTFGEAPTSKPVSLPPPNQGANDTSKGVVVQKDVTTVVTHAGVENSDLNSSNLLPEEFEMAALGDEDDLELCSFISQTKMSTTSQSHAHNSSTSMLLDQIGKPVFVGQGPLSWWSLNSALRNESLTLAQQRSTEPPKEQHYVTMADRPNSLYEYSNLADLQKDLSGLKLDVQQGTAIGGGGEIPPLASATVHKLRYPIFLPGAQLVHGDSFLYVTHADHLDREHQPSNQSHKSGTLDDLALVAVEIRTGEITHLSRLGSDHLVSTSSGIAGGNNIDRAAHFSRRQPLDLRTLGYKLNRVELMADESGVWLIVPTIERSSSNSATSGPPRSQRHLVRRLHVIKLGFITAGLTDVGSAPAFKAHQRHLHHASMKLDWRMIGQMFIIDGILYGIKDNHSYSSRLQFAYDLYRCKLLSADYLNQDEPHRMFTNHFGDTQMIKYNPNEPKRLYTIDSGNLLWRPVKLSPVNVGAGSID